MAWVLLAVSLLGADTWQDSPVCCGKDTDCKGDRICENARCVSPPPARAMREGQRVSGELPMAAVRKVVDANMRDIQRCYERALLRNPRLAGKVTLEWTIGTDGSVTRAGTKLATLDSPEVIECMRASLVTWRFPEPKGGPVVVTYPFLFNSVGN
jgi:hypothetical protein